jgi:hypothetical protein
MPEIKNIAAESEYLDNFALILESLSLIVFSILRSVRRFESNVIRRLRSCIEDEGGIRKIVFCSEVSEDLCLSSHTKL